MLFNVPNDHYLFIQQLAFRTRLRRVLHARPAGGCALRARPPLRLASLANPDPHGLASLAVEALEAITVTQIQNL